MIAEEGGKGVQVLLTAVAEGMRAALNIS